MGDMHSGRLAGVARIVSCFPEGQVSDTAWGERGSRWQRGCRRSCIGGLVGGAHAATQ